MSAAAVVVPAAAVVMPAAAMAAAVVAPAVAVVTANHVGNIGQCAVQVRLPRLVSAAHHAGVEQNTYRINILVKAEMGKVATELVEAIMHYKFRPKYEGAI